MYELKKKIGKLLTSKSVGTGPSFYEKKNLPGRGLTKVEKHCFIPFCLDIKHLHREIWGSEINEYSYCSLTECDAVSGRLCTFQNIFCLHFQGSTQQVLEKNY